MISRMKKTTNSDIAFNILLYTAMILFSITVLYPFIYLTALSFNQGIDALRGGITLWPRKFTLENYKIIFQDPRLAHAVFISVLRTVIGTVTAVVFTGLVSYCLTKRNLIGYRFHITLYILPMYITAGIIPTYLTYRLFGLTNNFLVYIIPNFIWGFNLLIMRTFFDDLPHALEESALLDGAGFYTVFFKIIFPLSMPVIATISLFNAVWQWNYWLDTVIFTRSKNLDTLMSILSRMLMEQQSSDIANMRNSRRVKYLTPEVLKAAMTMVTTIPIILVYPFLQKYFVKGVMIGAVKG